jgi:hypothetical protein
MAGRDGVVLCHIKRSELSNRAVRTRFDVKVRNARDDV